MKKPIHFLIALAAILPLSALAQADGKRLGTIDELRACTQLQSDIDSRQTALKERSEKLTKATEVLSTQTAEVNAEAQKVEEDPSSTGSGRRARYERRLRTYKQELEAHRVAQESFNADRAKVEKDFTDFRDKCANMAFDSKDVEAVRKEREAAGKK